MLAGWLHDGNRHCYQRISEKPELSGGLSWSRSLIHREHRFCDVLWFPIIRLKDSREQTDSAGQDWKQDNGS